jgi:hypothetical protein
MGERLYKIVLTGASVAFLGMYLISFWRFGYVVPPGGDIIVHYSIIQELAQNGVVAAAKFYPPFFHLLVHSFGQLTDLHPLTVMLVMLPFVMLAGAACVSLVVGLLAGREARLTTFILLLFSMNQPWQTLYDGGFPNIIGLTIWIPLCIAAIIGWRRSGWWGYLVAAVGIIALHFTTHHLSIVELGIIVGGSLIFVVPWRYSRWAILGSVVCIAGFVFSPLGLGVRTLLSTVFQPQAGFPGFQLVGKLDNPNAIIGLGGYPENIGTIGFWLGWAGLIVWHFRKRFKGDRGMVVVILVWALLLLWMSQTPELVFPVRFVRELGVPLAIGTGLFVGWLTEWLPRDFRPWVVVGIIGVFIPLGVTRFIRTVMRYEYTVEYSRAYQQALVTVREPAYIIGSSMVPLFWPQHVQAPRAILAKPELIDRSVLVIEGKELDPSYLQPLTDAGWQRCTIYKDPLRTVLVYGRGTC